MLQDAYLSVFLFCQNKVSRKVYKLQKTPSISVMNCCPSSSLIHREICSDFPYTVIGVMLIFAYIHLKKLQTPRQTTPLKCISWPDVKPSLCGHESGITVLELLKALSVLCFPKAVVKHHYQDAVKHHLKLFGTRNFGLLFLHTIGEE